MTQGQISVYVEKHGSWQVRTYRDGQILSMRQCYPNKAAAMKTAHHLCVLHKLPTRLGADPHALRIQVG